MDGIGGVGRRGSVVDEGRCGDWSRKVLVAMDPELRVRRRSWRLAGRNRLGLAMCWDEVEEERRWTMRLVSTFSTMVGVGVRLRRAVAAAAEDKLLEEGWDLRKAWEAAEWADWEFEADSGCFKTKCVRTSLVTNGIRKGEEGAGPTR